MEASFVRLGAHIVRASDAHQAKLSWLVECALIDVEDSIPTNVVLDQLDHGTRATSKIFDAFVRDLLAHTLDHLRSASADFGEAAVIEPSSRPRAPCSAACISLAIQMMRR